jgi:hypothetical protein
MDRNDSIGPRSTAGEVALRLAELGLGMFGAIHPTEQDRVDLADALIARTVEWINERYALGIPSAAALPGEESS